MRTAPKTAPPPFTSVAPDTTDIDVRTYRFITPVFGGGVEPKKTDAVTPVRVASIRGQLRFWWRAVNPGSCTTVDQLRSAEAAVFGGIGKELKASSLVIRVVKQPGAPKPLTVLEGKFGTATGMSAIAYGAFPLRESKEPFAHGVLHDFEAQEFEAAFTYPHALEDDVHAALWAWAHFGSLGGRTRRGFGAIAQLTDGLPSIDEGWKKWVKAVDAPWPHLSALPTLKASPDGKPLSQLLGALQKLRQGEGMGRRKGRKRSYWPEPDTIRAHFPDQVGAKHRTPVTEQRGFPRAVFGTPIIFHFKQPDRHASPQEARDGADPNDSTLKPAGKSRLASSLVLRPHFAANGQYEAMALVLTHPAPAGGYVIEQKGRPPVTIPPSAGQPLELGDTSTFTDPIQRFLEELLR